MISKKSQIVVIDDSRVMCRFVAEKLKLLGYENLAVFNNAELALVHIHEQATKMNPVELVLSDWNMPNMSGIELLKRIRTEERYKKMIFVMLTAESKSSLNDLALAEGAQGYLKKPFNESDFKIVIDNVNCDVR